MTSIDPKTAEAGRRMARGMIFPTFIAALFALGTGRFLATLGVLHEHPWITLISSVVTGWIVINAFCVANRGDGLVGEHRHIATLKFNGARYILRTATCAVFAALLFGVAVGAALDLAVALSESKVYSGVALCGGMALIIFFGTIWLVGGVISQWSLLCFDHTDIDVYKLVGR